MLIIFWNLLILRITTALKNIMSKAAVLSRASKPIVLDRDVVQKIVRKKKSDAFWAKSFSEIFLTLPSVLNRADKMSNLGWGGY